MSGESFQSRPRPKKGCSDSNNNNNNNYYFFFQLFIIYLPSQQLQGQLQTHNCVDISNYIMEQYNIKSKTNYRQALEKKHINAER
jgi:hypothetical protein